MHDAPPICEILISRDGRRIVTLAFGFKARVWDGETGGLLHELTLPKRLANWLTKRTRDEPSHHPQAIASGLLSRVLAWSDIPARVLLWDTRSGELLLVDKSRIEIAILSPDGARFAVITENGKAQLWHADAGVGRYDLEHDADVKAVAFNRDGRLLATATNDCTVRLWDAMSGAPVGPVMRHDDEMLLWDGTAGAPTGIVLHRDKDGLVRPWNVEAGAFDGSTFHHDLTYTLEFSPAGPERLTFRRRHTVHVRDVATGALTGPPVMHWQWLGPVVFTPDGTRFATATWVPGAWLWDAATCAPVAGPFPGDGIFSPDGRSIVTIDNDHASSTFTAQLYCTASSAPIGLPMMHDAAISGAAFSHDGTRIVTASGSAAQVWDTATGEASGPRLQHHRERHRVTQAAFSEDGERVFTAYQVDGAFWEAQVWSARSGAPINVPLTHDNAVPR